MVPCRLGDRRLRRHASTLGRVPGKRKPVDAPLAARSARSPHLAVVHKSPNRVGAHPEKFGRLPDCEGRHPRDNTLRLPSNAQLNLADANYKRVQTEARRLRLLAPSRTQVPTGTKIATKTRTVVSVKDGEDDEARDTTSTVATMSVA